MRRVNAALELRCNRGRTYCRRRFAGDRNYA